MTAYYNEIDPYAAQWLRNLVAAVHIAPGDVDERSIEDVHPDDLKPYTQRHFFAGVGVWSYALRLAGWPDDRPVWTGSCPCQPFSAAGQAAGFDDERHLWPDFHWLIKERRRLSRYPVAQESRAFKGTEMVQAKRVEPGNPFDICGIVCMVCPGCGVCREMARFSRHGDHMTKPKEARPMLCSHCR